MGTSRTFINEDGSFAGTYSGGMDNQIQEDGSVVKVQLDPVIPEGLIEVPTAPTDHRALFAGFSMGAGENGATFTAVGGDWDYSGIPIPPDVPGFLLALRGAAGSAVAANALARAYPNLAIALQMGQWDDAAALIVDARDTAVLSADLYNGFKAAAVAFGIPVSLP